MRSARKARRSLTRACISAEKATGVRQIAARLRHQIVHPNADQAAHHFGDEARAAERRKIATHAIDGFGHERGLSRQLFQRKKPGVNAVIDIMIVVGDVVRQRRHLRFQTRERAQFQRMNRIILADITGQIRQRPPLAQQRAVVLHQPFQRLPGKVQSVEARIALLELCHEPQRLRVVIEAAIGLHAGVQRALAGMAEWRMAEVVRQRQRLGEVFVQPQDTRAGAGNLRHFQRVRQAGAVMVALMGDENLGFLLQAAEGG